MSAGRNTVLNVLLDAVAVAERAVRKSGAILAAVDEAIRVDMTDDQDWQTADAAIGQALGFMDDLPGSKRKTDLTAELLKAKHALRAGMAIDFSDVSKERIKALIVPEHTALERVQEQFRGLITRLEANHG